MVNFSRRDFVVLPIRANGVYIRQNVINGQKSIKNSPLTWVGQRNGTFVICSSTETQLANYLLTEFNLDRPYLFSIVLPIREVGISLYRLHNQYKTDWKDTYVILER